MASRRRNVKPFSLIAAVVFGLVAMVQLVRLVLEWPVVVNGINIPLWVSVIAFLVAAGLAVMVWREARQ
jgi:hypothetical protein